MAYDLSREEAQAMMTKFGNQESIQAISVATGRDPQTECVGPLFWLTLFVYSLAKPVVISSSLIPGFHWWSGNSPYGILSIR